MNDYKQYTAGPASAAQSYQLWSVRVDALECHLASRLWVLAAVSLLLIAYPIARIVIPSVLQAAVPDVVRTVINLL